MPSLKVWKPTFEIGLESIVFPGFLRWHRVYIVSPGPGKSKETKSPHVDSLKVGSTVLSFPVAKMHITFDGNRLLT